MDPHIIALEEQLTRMEAWRDGLQETVTALEAEKEKLEERIDELELEVTDARDDCEGVIRAEVEEHVTKFLDRVGIALVRSGTVTYAKGQNLTLDDVAALLEDGVVFTNGVHS